jgi:hypothetical protein
VQNCLTLTFTKHALRGADFRYADLDDDAPSGPYLRDTIMPNGEIAAKSPTIEIKGRPDGGWGEQQLFLTSIRAHFAEIRFEEVRHSAGPKDLSMLDIAFLLPGLIATLLIAP